MVTFSERLFSDPLNVALVISVVFFIPIMIIGPYDYLDGSIVEQGLRSIEKTVAASATIALCIPLLIDVLLDLFQLKNSEFMGYRLVSMSCLLGTSIPSLIYQQDRIGTTLTVVLYCWGWFIELTVAISFLHFLAPKFFNAHVVYTLITINFVFTMGLNLNCNSVTGSDALYVVCYMMFYLFNLVFAVSAMIWQNSLIASYLASKLPFTQWAKRLDYDQVAAITLVVGLGTVATTMLVVYTALEPDFPQIYNASDYSRIANETCRSITCVYTYIIPSRLFREKLLAAKKDLETKTEFIKYLSHELRTPASVLDLGMKIAVDQMAANDTEGATGTIKDMSETTSALIEILDDLLLYEKIARDALVLNYKELDPLRTIGRIVKNYRNFRFEVDTDVALQGDVILADVAKLRRIFNAVLAPALQVPADRPGKVEFSFHVIKESVLPSPSRRINLSRATVSPESHKRWISIRILDTVSNRTAEDVLLLLQDDGMFERVGHDDGQGSGFGLWIAKNLMSLHDAHISATVIPSGGGIEFDLRFPLLSADSRPLHVSESGDASTKIGDNVMLPRGLSAELNDSTDAGNYKGDIYKMLPGNSPRRQSSDDVQPFASMSMSSLNVLLIDDSTMIRKLVSQLMKALGHTYYEASDGAKGIDVLRRLMKEDIGIDVILMDNQMPVMMGMEATRVIREELGYKGVILGVTGNALEEDIKQFVANGADEVIIKPLTKDNFGEAFKRVRSLVENTQEKDYIRLKPVLQETQLAVLLVDDSSMIRKLIAQLMKSLGHMYYEASDGVHGIEVLRRLMTEEITVDVILMDNQMPVMMGMEATRVIRKELGYKGVILGVTGNALEEDIKQFVANGADEVIIKPLTKDNFKDVYERVRYNKHLAVSPATFSGVAPASVSYSSASVAGR